MELAYFKTSLIFISQKLNSSGEAYTIEVQYSLMVKFQDHMLYSYSADCVALNKLVYLLQLIQCNVYK